MNTFVIAGIGTEIGKTLVSAILTEALESDYWKPIQAGTLSNTDTDTIRNFISNKKSVLHKERILLKKAMSPHAAAKAEKIRIKLSELSIPKTKNTLLIELAGGVMVPFNEKELNIDLLKKWKLPVILVSKNYLGSINHTLLSIEFLKQNKIPIAGIIFNGKTNKETESLILNYTKLPCLARIKDLKKIDKIAIKREALKIRSFLKSHKLCL